MCFLCLPFNCLSTVPHTKQPPSWLELTTTNQPDNLWWQHTISDHILQNCASSQARTPSTMQLHLRSKSRPGCSAAAGKHQHSSSRTAQRPSAVRVVCRASSASSNPFTGQQQQQQTPLTPEQVAKRQKQLQDLIQETTKLAIETGTHATAPRRSGVLLHAVEMLISCTLEHGAKPPHNNMNHYSTRRASAHTRN